MKKMTALILVIVALAGAVALLAFRQRRPAPTQAFRPTTPAPDVVPEPAPAPRPMDAFQSAVKLEPPTNTKPDAEAKRRLLERLQREEARQKPQEQRN